MSRPATLDVVQLAIAPVGFPPERLAATLDDAPRWGHVNALGEVYAAQRCDGSNNWAVAPSRTDDRPARCSRAIRTALTACPRCATWCTCPAPIST